MPDRISFTDHYLHRLNSNGWAEGLIQLRRLNIDLAIRNSNNNQQDHAIEFDLSRATFADFAILGRILILATALTRRGVNLSVRMPSDKLFIAERDMIENSERQIERNARYGYIERLRRQRMNCRLFLSQSGFDGALKTGPLAGKVKIYEGDEQPSEGDGSTASVVFDPNSQEKYHAPQRLRRFLPYRWMDVNSDAISGQIPDLSDIEQSLTEMGLPSYDAMAVSQGILREATENVRDHSASSTSRPAHALLGASLVQSSAYRIRQQGFFDEHLQSFAGWASSMETPILRLFVGDAGQGIQATAISSHRSDAQTVGEAIIAALDYHPPSPQATTGPHGLWKVNELVRGFQGSVMIFSGPAAAGYLYDSHKHKVISELPFPLSGTVMECNLLAMAGSETEPRVGAGSAFPPLTEAPTVGLRCVAALLRNGIGLDPEEIAEIEQALESLEEPTTAGVAISVEMRPGETSPNDWDIQQAIRQIYGRAKETAPDAMVAVVFAGVSWRLLALAVLDFNLQLDIGTRPGSASSAISMMIMTADRRHYWVGGSPGLRKMLYLLSTSGNAQHLTTVSQLLDADETHWLMEASPAPRRVVTLESEMVQLAFYPHHLIFALMDYFRHRLALAAAEQHLSIRSNQVFVTPSLREVGMWVDAQNALHAAKCTRIAGFLMAFGIQAMMRSQSGSAPEIQVVRLGSLEEELASTFALALTGIERELGFEELTNLRTIRPEAASRVVLCAGIISNGASVRRAIRELWHRGFSDVAVAAIIDARDLTHTIYGKDEGPEHLTVYENRVPLFSLTSISVAAHEIDEQDRDRIFIDPVIRQPMPHKYPRAKTFMNQEFYKEAIRRSDAARLGHIRWAGRRHYAAYIDTARLFSDVDWSRPAFRMMIERIDADHIDAGCEADEESSACVIYPGEPNENLAYVAQRLLAVMRTDTPKRRGIICEDPIPVPRATVNDEWGFPRALHFPKGVNHIVAIDTASRTGATLRHLIRLAAQPQIKIISVFSLVNGMSDLDALALQETASVRARACDDDGVWSEALVPVNVRYLVRTAAGSTGGGSCSQCSLRDEYSALPSMPDSFEFHRDWLLRMLETRSRQSIFADTAADLYGMPINQEDCIEYLLWRSYLAEAALDTEVRLTVVDKITELAEKCRAPSLTYDLRRRRDALVRVLAAENDRLQAAPLWFTSVRTKIMMILWSLVEPPNSYAIDQALRVQAIIGLSRGDVRGFSARYAQLVRDSCDNDLVVRQVLMEAVRLINGRSGLPDWSDTLADQILMLSAEMQILPESTGSNLARTTLVEGLNYLAVLVKDERGLG